MMTLRPLRLREANAFVESFHRHSRPVVGARFCIGLQQGGELVGVAVVGRPISRMLDADYVAEVLRLCTNDKAGKGACSKLYAASWRAWRAMGGTRLITYSLATESGASLRGAGWRNVGVVSARSWDTPSRRREWQPVYGQTKLRWEIVDSGQPT